MFISQSQACLKLEPTQSMNKNQPCVPYQDGVTRTILYNQDKHPIITDSTDQSTNHFPANTRIISRIFLYSSSLFEINYILISKSTTLRQWFHHIITMLLNH